MPTTKVSVRVKNPTGPSGTDKASSLPEENKLDVPTTGEADKPAAGDVVSGVIDLRTQGASNQYHPSTPRRYFNGEQEEVYERDQPTQKVKGFLDITGDGHGFLRPKFRPSDGDIYISASQIRKFALRPGDDVEGLGRPPKENERYFGLLKVVRVNDVDAEKQNARVKFEDLTPIYPNCKLKLEISKTLLSTRVIDLIAPIGMGQRGMIVSPPKAGKTTILKDIARGISENFPKVHLMAALIGERPEEVTDISRSYRF